MTSSEAERRSGEEKKSPSLNIQSSISSKIEKK